MNDSTSILIVEDEQELSEFLTQNFQGSNNDINVVAVDRADQALKTFKKNSFDVVIADMILPDSSGIELMKKLRKISEEIKVIIMTAYGSEKIEKLAADLGAYAYIKKPFPFATIENLVLRALGR